MDFAALRRASCFYWTDRGVGVVRLIEPRRGHGPNDHTAAPLDDAEMTGDLAGAQSAQPAPTNRGPR